MEDLSFDDLRGKDAAEKLQGKWLVEVAELAGMKRADVEKVKAFVASQCDRYRPPYAKRAEDFPRRCVFIGTTNRRNYLLDETGNRRFLPIHLTAEIDVERVERDVEQLWGEAVHLYRSGERALLPRELWGHAAREQASRVAEDPWQDRIDSHINAVLQREPTRKVFPREELLGLLKPTAQQGQLDSARLTDIMERLGFETTKNPQMDPILGKKVRGFVRRSG
jgi:predicted P-loop ATPase